MSEVVSIYALHDPRSGAIRYVGKTGQRLSYRRTQHMRRARMCDDNLHSLNWLRELLAENMMPEVSVLEVLSPDMDWQARERFWIAHGIAEGWPLTNMTEGGEGIVNPSAELREAQSKRMKGNDYAVGNRNAAGKRSEAFCRQRAELAKGNRHALGHSVSEETRKGISENLKAYYENGGQAVRGEANGQAKLTIDQVRGIRRRYANGGVSMRGLAKDYPISYSTVANIIHRKRWQHVE